MKTAVSLLTDLQQKKVSSRELVNSSLAAIKNSESFNAYISVFKESALQQASITDAARQKGEVLGPLAGLPIAVKDNIVTTEGTTTCGSRILENFKSPYNATVVEKLKAAGAIIIGKTNCDEFAMGSSNENSAFGPVKNPLDPTRIPGGSSGGSAAALAAHTVPLALGSDTGGSIRQPAACCSIVGLKPSYGRVSRYGLVAYASSLDQIGPMAHTVEDAALLLDVIAGDDPRDQTSSSRPVDSYLKNLKEKKGPVSIGVPREVFDSPGLHADVKNSIEKTLNQLQAAGNKLVDISLPHTPYGVAAYYVLCTAEASSNLSRYDGVRYSHRSKDVTDLHSLYTKSREEGFGFEVRKRILLGTFVLSSGFYDAYYATAQKVRRKITEDFTNAFSKCDVICTPTMPTLPPMLGQMVSNPMESYLGDVFTVGVNLAGLPALSIPAIKNAGSNLCPGLQIIAPAFAELALLQAAYRFEEVLAA